MRVWSVRVGALWLVALAALGALLLTGCVGDTEEEQADSAAKIVDVLTTDAGPPYAGEFTATFDQASFTTTYAVEVNLPFGARQDESSIHLHAKWTGPNCGMSGIVNFADRFEPGKSDWDFGYTRSGDSNTGGLITFRWVHPHPPCGNTPDHKDATITVVVSNPSGSFTCTYVGAATGKGTCQ